MAEISYEESVFVEADPGRVFDYRLDFSNLPEYNSSVSNLRRIDDGTTTGVGAEYRFDLTLPGAPESVEIPLRVTVAERPARLGYETGPGWMARADSTFEPDGAGTLVILTYSLTFPGDIDAQSAAAVEASGREQARTELDNLKKILES